MGKNNLSRPSDGMFKNDLFTLPGYKARIARIYKHANIHLAMCKHKK